MPQAPGLDAGQGGLMMKNYGGMMISVIFVVGLLALVTAPLTFNEKEYNMQDNKTKYRVAWYTLKNPEKIFRGSCLKSKGLAEAWARKGNKDFGNYLFHYVEKCTP
jgi:hypothetical protein